MNTANTGMQNLTSSQNEYELEYAVGAGTYGTVYKSKHAKNSHTFAIKKFKATKAGEGISLTAFREIGVRLRTHSKQLLRELQHENIVNLREIFSKNDRGQDALFLVFDYAE